MSRLDELNNTITGLQALMAESEKIIEKSKAEIAALEAQERKPREITIFLGEHGAASFFEKDTYRMAKFREVKPIVVTEEVAMLFCHSTTLGGRNVLVSRFKKLGIDAISEPSND